MLSVSAHAADELPPAIIKQLPVGFSALAFIKSDLNGDTIPDYLVVAHSDKEVDPAQVVDGERVPAPKRPLLIFIQDKDGVFQLTKRNDNIVLAADQGEQCDPFIPEEGLVAKGSYFTVQNTEACGQHWTDYITFRYDAKLHDWVFHKQIYESWKFNPSQDDDADSLIPDTHKVIAERKDHPVLFEQYRPE